MSLIERHGMSRAVACTPTRELRDELEAAGIELPGHTELRELSRALNEWLEAARPNEGKAHSYTFFNLFCVRARTCAFAWKLGRAESVRCRP